MGKNCSQSRKYIFGKVRSDNEERTSKNNNMTGVMKEKNTKGLREATGKHTEPCEDFCLK